MHAGVEGSTQNHLQKRKIVLAKIGIISASYFGHAHTRKVQNLQVDMGLACISQNGSVSARKLDCLLRECRQGGENTCVSISGKAKM